MINTISIKSYLKVSKKYVDVFEFKGVIKDSDYIEGAMDLEINHVQLITIEMWDYIDQLWAYFTEGLVSISNNNEFHTYFPDQPIAVHFKPIRDHVLVRVICHSEVKAIIHKNEFIKVMSEHAIRFFEKLSSIEGNKNYYQYELEKLKRIDF